MLYGASPLMGRSAAELGLRSVMTLETRLIALRSLRRGDAIGYGGTYVCPEDMPVGVAAIGYGDGYPRHAPAGTPVLVRGQRAPLVGRVSMDTINIDLRGAAGRIGWRSRHPSDDLISLLRFSCRSLPENLDNSIGSKPSTAILPSILWQGSGFCEDTGFGARSCAAHRDSPAK
jgi:hypothetical protein